MRNILSSASSLNHFQAGIQADRPFSDELNIRKKDIAHTDYAFEQQ